MKSFFGREFIINIPGIHTMLLDEDTELQKLCDKVLSEEEGISSLVRMLRNNFQTLSRRSNRVRELISNGVNTLAEQYTLINDRIIRNHVLHDSDQVGYNTRWEDIVNMLEVYHHIQINFYHIASLYQKLQPFQKALYWEGQGIGNPENIVANLEKVIIRFSNNSLQEPVKSYVLGDLFRGYHDAKGRLLLDEIVESAELSQIKIDVVSGKNNWVTIEIKGNNKDSDAMATAKLDDDIVADQSPREYVKYLARETTLGKTNIIECVTLQYTPEQNIVFSDTADIKGKHLYYLAENYVTVMHELGHMWSFLRGVNYHPTTPIPDRLQPFHTVEEYLTTSVRPSCEDNLDPLKIKRVGHSAREFRSMAVFKLEKESITDCDVKLQRQDACNRYLKKEEEKPKDERFNQGK